MIEREEDDAARGLEAHEAGPAEWAAWNADMLNFDDEPESRETTMDEPRHTPGPWVASNTEGPWTCDGDDGVVEAVSPDGEVRREICHFLLDTGEHGDSEDLAEDLANARLIAAAPELLAACLELVKRIQQAGIDYPHTMRGVNAALARARGEINTD